MAFQGNALDKLKADKLQRNRSRQRRRVEKQRSGRDAVPSQRHKQSAALLSFRNRPKPVDDTFTLNFCRVVAKRVLRCWRQVVLPARQ
jgi:hypothetical protein